MKENRLRKIVLGLITFTAAILFFNIDADAACHYNAYINVNGKQFTISFNTEYADTSSISAFPTIYLSLTISPTPSEEFKNITVYNASQPSVHDFGSDGRAFSYTLNVNEWKSSFFSESDSKKCGNIYYYYDKDTINGDENVSIYFTADKSYVDRFGYVEIQGNGDNGYYDSSTEQNNDCDDENIEKARKEYNNIRKTMVKEYESMKKTVQAQTDLEELRKLESEYLGSDGKVFQLGNQAREDIQKLITEWPCDLPQSTVEGWMEALTTNISSETKKINRAFEKKLNELARADQTHTSEEKQEYKQELKRNVNDTQEAVERIRVAAEEFLTQLDKGSAISESCSGILSPSFVDLIEEILGYIRIIVPILVIVLGTLDFTKAVFAEEKDELSKATSKFTKRCIMAVVVFFVPTILSFLVKTYNSVVKNIDNIPPLTEVKDCLRK